MSSQTPLSLSSSPGQESLGDAIASTAEKVWRLLKTREVQNALSLAAGIIGVATTFVMDHWNPGASSGKNIVDMQYYVMTTISTVGYGDVSPESTAARFVFSNSMIAILGSAAREAYGRMKGRVLEVFEADQMTQDTKLLLRFENKEGLKSALAAEKGIDCFTLEQTYLPAEDIDLSAGVTVKQQSKTQIESRADGSQKLTEVIERSVPDGRKLKMKAQETEKDDVIQCKRQALQLMSEKTVQTSKTRYVLNGKKRQGATLKFDLYDDFAWVEVSLPGNSRVNPLDVIPKAIRPFIYSESPLKGVKDQKMSEYTYDGLKARVDE